VKPVGILATASRELGARFIHVSTDYVYDGKASTPYTESSITSPVNVYGESKLSGEQQAIKENPSSVIVRTSWVYSSYGKNFVKTMLRLMKEKTEISVVG
jgi:dTDP-4-dehydrorhamnose reductase